MNESIKIMIVAGEDSGDSHAAALVRSLNTALPERQFSFFGATGSALRREGVETIVKADDFGIVGVPEVLKAVPMFLKVLKRLTDEAVKRQPDLVILVDFPEFNLKLAKRLKKRGLKVVYYISPQIWAWRGYRIRTMRKHVDLLLTILPFEKAWYERRGVDHVEFVGNPLGGKVRSKLDPSEFRASHGISKDGPLIALLPGSRSKEISRVLPTMLLAAKSLKSRLPEASFAVALARSRSESEVLKVINEVFGSRSHEVKVIGGQTYELLNAADAAAVTSGTATLETSIIGTPQVIVYKTSSLNYLLLRPLISIESFGLANLIAEKPVFSELLQNEFSAGAVAAEIKRLLTPAVNKEMRREAALIAEKLGSDNASDRAADSIIEFSGWRK